MNTTTNLGLQTYSNPNTDIFDPMVVEVPNMLKIDQLAGTINGRFEELTNTVNSAVETVQSMEDDVEQLQTDVDNKPNINNTATSDSDTYSSRKINELITNLNQLITALSNQLDEKQDLITGAGSSVTENNLQSARVLVSDSNGKITNSNITSTQLSYLSGLTSNIQSQLNNFTSLTTIVNGANIPGVSANITVPNLNNFKELIFCIGDNDGAIATCVVLPTEVFKNRPVHTHFSELTSATGWIDARHNIEYINPTTISVVASSGMFGTLFMFGR